MRAGTQLEVVDNFSGHLMYIGQTVKAVKPVWGGIQVVTEAGDYWQVTYKEIKFK